VKYAVFCFLRYQQVKIDLETKLHVMRNLHPDEHATCVRFTRSLRNEHEMELALTPSLFSQPGAADVIMCCLLGVAHTSGGGDKCVLINGVTMNEHEVLGRTNRLISFDTKQAA
jgi:hypothetical protein